MNREFPWYNMEIVIVEANFLMYLNFILLMGKMECFEEQCCFRICECQFNRQSLKSVNQLDLKAELL